MKLFEAILSRNKVVYVIANEEYDARDKINDWVKKNFFGGSPISLMELNMIAEKGNKGYVPELI